MHFRLLSTVIFAAAIPCLAQSAQVTALGNLAHTVDSLEKTVPFYRDTLGLAFRGGRNPLQAPPQALDADMSRFTGTQGAKFRAAVFDIPGAQFGMELTEFTGTARNSGVPRIQDPGAAMLSLQVKDIDSLMAKVKQAGLPVVTLGGQPVNPAGPAAPNMREVVIRDPDGFLVQFVRPDPLPETAAAATGNIFGGSVSIAIDNAEKSMEFYKKAIGFEHRPIGAEATNKVVADLIGLPNSKWRITHGTIPGFKLDFAMIEYRGVDKKPFILGAHDPGSPAFTMVVADIEKAVAAWKSAGGTVMTTGGTPVVRANGAGNVFVRDINGLLWEFIQRPKQQ